MPILQTTRTIIEVTLPSFGTDDPAIVKMYDTILAGDYEDSDSENRADRAYGILTKIIVSWNLTDQIGNAIPITIDAIRSLPIGDVNAINKALKDNTLTEIKKN